MAIYKATYCYPLLNSLDVRIVADTVNTTPCEWFTCKLDTSNKRVTGYRIRILDSLNNQIFPSKNQNNGEGYISPLSELPEDVSDEYVNSGLNGTLLNIPFFQNYFYSTNISYNNMKTPSFNAIYYVPKYKVDYVFVSNEGWDVEAGDRLTNKGWDGIVNGEVVLTGETILILSSIRTTISGTEVTAASGIWQVENDGSLSPYKDASGAAITSAYMAGQYVTIAKGQYHDRIYQCNGADSFTIQEDHTGMWIDIEGNPIAIDIDGGSYKWEVTLYQGTVEAQTKIVTSGYNSIPVSYNDYSNLDFEWFDTVLNSGTILGSTNKRVQIASSLDDNAVLPQGTLNSPLVLQGKYAQLLTEDEQQIASRAYVQNYDSTFGHVYPINGGFQPRWVENATKISFYKHSNNVEDILAAERVSVATDISDLVEGDGSDTGWKIRNGNLNLYISYYDYNYVGKISEERFNNGTTYYLDKNGTVATEWDADTNYYTQYTKWDMNTNLGTDFSIDGHKLEEGDIVLVKNQTRSCENGVYIAHQLGTGWTRSGSYKTWGDFIGAILFVMNGTINGGTNWESLATAGGTIFDTSVTAGESPLLFTPEKTITLFPNLVKDTVELTGYYRPDQNINPAAGEYYELNGDIYTARVIRSNAEYDEVPVSVGDHIFCHSSLGDGHGEVIEILDIEYQKFDCGVLVYPNDPDTDTLYVDDTDPSVTTDDRQFMVPNQQEGFEATADDATYWILTYKVIATYGLGDYLEVENGENYGHSVIKVVGAPLMIEITNDLSVAYVLKNGIDYTYVSPYIGLRQDMVLKILNNQKVTFADNTSSKWLRVRSEDPSLLSVNSTVWRIRHKPLASPLLSSSIGDENVPYSYEVRTFYRASDENPFNVYEAPYLKLSDGGSGYTNLITYQPYDVVEEDNNSQYEDYLVKQAQDNNILVDYLVQSPSLTAIAQRYVTLQGFYYQFQQASWESYRWVLMDYYGNVLQDTGNKYDRDMKVTFYGLSNETLHNNNIYYAVLYVTDSIGNDLSFTVRLIVDPNSMQRSNIDFSAEFDCSTHSVILSYQDNVYVAPSVEYNNTVWRYNAISDVLWDDSYYADGGSLYIKDVENDYGVPLVNIYEGYLSHEWSGLSFSSDRGLNYSHYFLYQENFVKPEVQELTVTGNEAYLEGEFVLDDNYCGKFASIKLEGPVNGSSVAIEIGIPENFEDGYTKSNLSSNRNRFTVNIVRTNESSEVVRSETAYLFKNATQPITWRTVSGSIVFNPKYFILQREESQAINNREYHSFVYNFGDKNCSVWYKPIVSEDGKTVKYLNSSYPFGNSCLVRFNELAAVSHTAPMYWAENRGTLFFVTPTNAVAKTMFGISSVYGINLTESEVNTSGSKISDEDFIPSWPKDDTLYMWTEQDTPSTLPSTWNAINGLVEGTYMNYWKPMPRHPGTLSKQTFRLVIRVLDLDGLYSNATTPTSISITGDASQQYRTNLGTYATVDLIPIETNDE